MKVDHDSLNYSSKELLLLSPPLFLLLFVGLPVLDFKIRYRFWFLLLFSPLFRPSGLGGLPRLFRAARLFATAAHQARALPNDPVIRKDFAAMNTPAHLAPEGCILAWSRIQLTIQRDL